MKLLHSPSTCRGRCAGSCVTNASPSQRFRPRLAIRATCWNRTGICSIRSAAQELVRLLDHDQHPRRRPRRRASDCHVQPSSCASWTPRSRSAITRLFSSRVPGVRQVDHRQPARLEQVRVLDRLHAAVVVVEHLQPVQPRQPAEQPPPRDRVPRRVGRVDPLLDRRDALRRVQRLRPRRDRRRVLVVVALLPASCRPARPGPGTPRPRPSAATASSAGSRGRTRRSPAPSAPARRSPSREDVQVAHHLLGDVVGLQEPLLLGVGEARASPSPRTATAARTAEQNARRSGWSGLAVSRPTRWYTRHPVGRHALRRQSPAARAPSRIPWSVGRLVQVACTRPPRRAAPPPCRRRPPA